MSNRPNTKTFTPIEFSVDSALLRELGERLVGKPHIALAELVKNSYDADATKVEIEFGKNEIEIRDNGHGMSQDEFRRFWMRVGSPHKQAERVSRKYKRPVTGSKGVGRLAVQFLADNLRLSTVSNSNDTSGIEAEVDWNQAVEAGELIKAKAYWKSKSSKTTFPEEKKHGTTLILTGLHQTWTVGDLENLAKEVWVLQPPFRRKSVSSTENGAVFEVEVKASESAVSVFERQMEAGLNQWIAKISGKLHNDADTETIPYVEILIEFNDGSKVKYDYEVENCRVYQVEFEIRIFRLSGRQKDGIKVGEAKDYLDKFGGVHVYDSGFHLPYYGPDTDWLGIERDHAARLNKSELLPPELQVFRGLQFLPTQRRIFGVVNIDTGRERTSAGSRVIKSKGNLKTESENRKEQIKEDDFLKIQVTRDRLADNGALQDLRKIVRFALDYYATETQRRNQSPKIPPQVKNGTTPASAGFEKVEAVLEYYEPQIPEDVFSDLKEQIRKTSEATESEAEEIVRKTRLLGSLATAGISALSYQHEIDKQLNLLEDVASDIAGIQVEDYETRIKLNKVSMTISGWLDRAKATRNLFSFMTDEDNRDLIRRFKARNTIEQIISQMGILLRTMKIDVSGVSDSLFLPEGSFAEWSSVFQNVLLNASNAMLDSREKLISVSSETHGKRKLIFVQDTGTGVNLKIAAELFEPFIRKLKLSPDNRALGLGGTGLGLTIVRMLATNLGCEVSFVEPESGYKTAFRLSWSEK